jgi:hypothetical protein
MRSPRPILLIVFCCCAAAASWAAPMSLHEYQAQLKHLQEQALSPASTPTDLAQLGRALPEFWEVEREGTTYTVPMQSLRNELMATGGDAVHRNQHLKKAQELLAMMQNSTSDLQAPANSPDAHAAANRILAQREFRLVKSQSWIEQKARFWRAVDRFLYKIFGSAATWKGMKLVVYAIVAGVFGFFVWWIARLLLRGAPEQLSLPDGPVISERNPAEWLTEARAAAERGEWRDAVRLAYWAGISSLEARGMWRPDRARTPREYLRLLGKQNSCFASLLVLTRHFERIWYGGTSATAEDFRTALGELEALGCAGTTARVAFAGDGVLG